MDLCQNFQVCMRLHADAGGFSNCKHPISHGARMAQDPLAAINTLTSAANGTILADRMQSGMQRGCHALQYFAADCIPCMLRVLLGFHRSRLLGSAQAIYVMAWRVGWMRNCHSSRGSTSAMSRNAGGKRQV